MNKSTDIQYLYVCIIYIIDLYYYVGLCILLLSCLLCKFELVFYIIEIAHTFCSLKSSALHSTVYTYIVNQITSLNV